MKKNDVLKVMKNYVVVWYVGSTMVGTMVGTIVNRCMFKVEFFIIN